MLRLISARLTTPGDEEVCFLCIYGLLFLSIATVVYAVANIMLTNHKLKSSLHSTAIL